MNLTARELEPSCFPHSDIARKELRMFTLASMFGLVHMRARSLIPVLSIVLSVTGWSQTSVTVLQPDSMDGMDASVYSCVPCGYANSNFGNIPGLHALAWTNNGAPSMVRSLLRFPLDTIPPEDVVLTAHLSIHHDPISIENSHSSLSGPNSGLVQRITSAWDEQTVTWNTQPSATAIGQVIIPATTSPTLDLLDIDVTGLVIAMMEQGDHGFLLRLGTESYYRSLVLASSDHPDKDLHPMLVITHQSGAVGIGTRELRPFRIHPNPCEGLLVIDVPRSFLSMEMVDALGRVVHTIAATAPGPLTVDLHDRNPGHYVLRIHTDRGTEAHRLVLQ